MAFAISWTATDDPITFYDPSTWSFFINSTLITELSAGTRIFWTRAAEHVHGEAADIDRFDLHSMDVYGS